MANSTRICKVCGKEYPYCKTEFTGNIFRWQDVACSPEHASIYFAQIEEARKKKSSTVVDSDPKHDVIDYYDDDEDFDDEDLDDEEDEYDEDDEY